MNIYVGDKIKSLRAEKEISQEKLAQYLNVSYQAVSKWENGNTYPDISLLPEIARFFGVTVDELLQVEKIDEQKLYNDYEQQACKLYRNGDIEASLNVWKEAYHDMPNNPAVKEKLMSAYFDTDKIKYQKEIIEIAAELYNATLIADAGDTEAFYRGQAITQLSRTYAANGDIESAEKWATKASYLMHSQEFLFADITEGKDLLTYFRFANYWYFKKLFYMACRISKDSELSKDNYSYNVFKTLSELYEVVYPDGDMDFEMLHIAYILNRCIAEYEANAQGDEVIVCNHLSKAFMYAKKSVDITNHKLTHPLFMGLETEDAPTDNKQIVRALNDELDWDCFAAYKNCSWYVDLKNDIAKIL